jgi:uncharacterized protein (DUF849 family)
VSALARETDAVINITTGGAMTMTVEERLEAAMLFEPEVASLNMWIDQFQRRRGRRA